MFSRQLACQNIEVHSGGCGCWRSFYLYFAVLFSFRFFFFSSLGLTSLYSVTWECLCETLKWNPGESQGRPAPISPRLCHWPQLGLC